MPQQGYLSTDPNAGQPVTPPTAPPPGTYLSTDPTAGAPVAGRGAGPGAPPPAAGGRGGGPGNTRIAATTPPPSKEFYPGGWKAAGQDFAGMVGGGVAAAAAGAALPAVAPVAGVTAVGRMLPMAARVARGAAGIAGAGAGGAAASAVSGDSLADGEDSVWGAFKRQAEMEATGLGLGWGLSAIARRAIAGPVAKAARYGLEWLRSTEMTSVRDALERAQDAIRHHATQAAANKFARTQATTALDETIQAAKTEARGAASAAQATRAGLPGQIEGIRERGGTAEATARGRWPQSEAAVAPPQRPLPPPGQKVRYAFTQPGMGEGPDIPLYEVLDKSHPLAGSHVSAATLTEHGFPVPAHVPTAALNPTVYAAQATERAVSGPAQRSLDKLGQAVESAAESGPAVRWGPIQQKLRDMHAKIQPVALEESGALAANPNIAYFKDAEQARALLAKAGVELEAGHPLPGVLGKIEEIATDTLPFRDAHRFKRMLDDAIGWKPAGAVKAPAKTQLKQITKGIRGEIRQLMSVHQPYEQATAAYRDAATLFAPGGLARKIQAAAETNPEALVNTLVKPSEPTKFQMLKEVLTHHAKEGGDPEAGQMAWQAVQSTVMYQHLIKPGIDQFDKSVAKMHPEFLDLLTGDPYARQVFERLQTMADAVKGIRQQTAQELRGARGEAARVVAGHQQTAQAARGRQWTAEGRKAEITRAGAQEDAAHAVEGQRLQGERQDASRAVAHAKLPTAAERAFVESKLATQQGAGSQLSDAVYAAAAPLGSPRQLAGGARAFLAGPKVNDLIQWASFSPRRTQMFVRAVTGPAPGQAIAAMIRLYDWETGDEPPMAVGHQQAPGAVSPKQNPLTPPPGRR